MIDLLNKIGKNLYFAFNTIKSFFLISLLVV